MKNHVSQELQITRSLLQKHPWESDYGTTPQVQMFFQKKKASSYLIPASGLLQNKYSVLFPLNQHINQTLIRQVNCLEAAEDCRLHNP